ncbi:hypothetical protein IWW50_005961, partial [Coemansia erecta]
PPARPRRILIDLRDTSDVWQRRTVKDKLSLNSVRPRTLFEGVELPRFLKALSGHADAVPKKPRPASKKRTRTRSLKRRPRSHQGPRTPGRIVMPEPAVIESPNPAVQFTDPASPQVQMPMPTHFTADGVPDSQDAGHLQPPPDQSNRVSVASADDEAHPPQVFQVLERRNTNRGHKANQPSDAISPVLVTIARDGSIVSDPASRHSDEQTRRTNSSELPRAAPAAKQTSPVRRHASQRVQSPSASPASVGISTSHGTASFVTARMFPSTRLSEERATTSPALYPVAEESRDVQAEQPARRQSDEVSDIAMRKHLLVDQDAGMGHQAFTEWLDSQATEPHTIAQTISQASPLLHDPKPAEAVNPGIHMPQQQHYHPVPSSRDAHRHYTGSEQAAILEGLLTRMSDLESQFTCMEAILVTMEEKFPGVSAAPARSLSIRRPAKARPAVGRTPIVKAVGDAADETLPEKHRSPQHTETTPLSTTVTDAQSADAAAQGKNERIIAAEMAAARLADIIGRSRLEFNAATSDALSAIANLAGDIKLLDGGSRHFKPVDP